MMWTELYEQFDRIRAESKQKLQDALVDADDRGLFMDHMRRFRQEQEGEVLQYYNGHRAHLEEFFLRLSALAEVSLCAAYSFEDSRLREIYGAPSSSFHIVGMGKFGACEMNLRSDLDLIFLFDQHGKTAGPRVITNQEYFARLVQRVISNLSLLTRYGRAYPIDTKLRPSGRAGILVSSWQAFSDYQEQDARTWEKQALLKARPIEEAGALRQGMAERLERQIWDRSYSPNIASDIHRIRLQMERELAKEGSDYYNIKVGPGGLVDIEFLVQYLQLRHGGEGSGLRTPHTLMALRALTDAALLDAKVGQQLEQAYLFYRHIETELRRMKERSVDRFRRHESEELGRLVEQVGASSADALCEECESTRHSVRQSYQEVLGIK